MDAANVDLKGFTDEFYVKLCGARLAPVLDTLGLPRARDGRVDRDHDAPHPGKNDLERGARGDVRLDRARARTRRAAALHGVSSRLQDDRPRAHARGDAHRARAIALRAGLRYVYTGNVHDRKAGRRSARVREAAHRARLARHPPLTT
jgi:pyruvate formate lyase activating enzyme